MTDIERIRKLRPIDDEFMRYLFKDNIPLAQLVLRIITGKPDLVITELETQRDLKKLMGARSICLDAYGTDSAGKKYDLEIQRSDRGADPHRARYHSSALDVENLKAGQSFNELPDTYIIFITERDIYGAGEPLYIIERINTATNKPFNDGEHIIYVNGEYRGDSDIGKLMHDFNCSDPNNMNFKLMADSARFYKKNTKGVSEVSSVLDEMREEARMEGIKQGKEKKATESASKMIADGLPLKKVAEYSGLTVEEVESLKVQLAN